jgi:hypothetical protein
VPGWGMDFTPFDRAQSASPSRSYVRCMLVRSRRDLPANSNARGIPEPSGRVVTINDDGALAPASRSRGRRRNQVGRIVVSEMPGWVVLLRSPSAFRDWQGPGTRLKSIQQPGRLPADCFGHMPRRSWRPTPEHSVWRAARPPCSTVEAAASQSQPLAKCLAIGPPYCACQSPIAIGQHAIPGWTALTLLGSRSRNNMKQVLICNNCQRLMSEILTLLK